MAANEEESNRSPMSLSAVLERAVVDLESLSQRVAVLEKLQPSFVEGKKRSLGQCLYPGLYLGPMPKKFLGLF